MSTSRGEACGKVILLGEHAVVYGVPAIAVGIALGIRAKATALPGRPSRLRIVGWKRNPNDSSHAADWVGVEVDETDQENDTARAFRALLDVARGDDHDLSHLAVEVEADLPPGGGLGCSAAMGVAIARAVGGRPTGDAVQARAMAWERIFHGSPSGIDAAVAALGGCIFFRRGAPLDHVRVRRPLHLCIGRTGTPSSTKAMVDAVAALRLRRPELVATSFEVVWSLVQSARTAIEAGDCSALGRFMDLNQEVLRGLFVSSPEIERLCDLARGAGALGAKLTGAGGGGSVVALVSSAVAGEAVLRTWRSHGFDGFATGVEPRTHAAHAAT
jgi:mevalonate kinase